MGVLNTATRRQLLNILESMSLFDSSAGRDTLLQDLPPKLRAHIVRTAAKSTDLAEIVYMCDTWPLSRARKSILCTCSSGPQLI